jgi:hypothetical protein
MDQAELLAARAAAFGGVMAAALIFWFQGDADRTLLIGLLVAVAVSTWAAYVLGTQAIRKFVPELD